MPSNIEGLSNVLFVGFLQVLSHVAYIQFVRHGRLLFAEQDIWCKLQCLGIVSPNPNE